MTWAVPRHVAWQGCLLGLENTGMLVKKCPSYVIPPPNTHLTVLAYRPEDENHPTVKPDRVVDNLAHAVDVLLTT